MPKGYRIRQRRPEDDATLVTIENRAAQLFRAYGYGALADDLVRDVEHLRSSIEGQQVWVAVDDHDEATGLAAAAPRGDFLHLAELSVDPAHGRRGVGSALVLAVVEAARRANLKGTSLTTFRHVPFNAPFYSRFGFLELPLDEAPPLLRGIFDAEVPAGIDPLSRVLMIRPDLDS